MSTRRHSEVIGDDGFEHYYFNKLYFKVKQFMVKIGCTNRI